MLVCSPFATAGMVQFRHCKIVLLLLTGAMLVRGNTLHGCFRNGVTPRIEAHRRYSWAMQSETCSAIQTPNRFMPSTTLCESVCLTSPVLGKRSILYPLRLCVCSTIMWYAAYIFCKTDVKAHSVTSLFQQLFFCAVETSSYLSAGVAGVSTNGSSASLS